MLRKEETVTVLVILSFKLQAMTTSQELTVAAEVNFYTDYKISNISLLKHVYHSGIGRGIKVTFGATASRSILMVE